tara:strand:- start:6051 stop:6233 length:183 start_codon:yes stop_codon:yes gene_type:complete
MQHRLNPLKQKTNPVVSSLIKVFVVLTVLGAIFYFVEKIQLPSPQKEIQKDVTDQIKRIK